MTRRRDKDEERSWCLSCEQADDEIERLEDQVAELKAKLIEVLADNVRLVGRVAAKQQELEFERVSKAG